MSLSLQNSHNKVTYSTVRKVLYGFHIHTVSLWKMKLMQQYLNKSFLNMHKVLLLYDISLHWRMLILFS